MELVVSDGDYRSDGNGALEMGKGSRAVLQQALWRLTVRRGSFPFLPELGSRLYLLPRVRREERAGAAKQYVEEALAGEPGLKVVDVTLTGSGEGTMDLTVEMEYGGEHITGRVQVE